MTFQQFPGVKSPTRNPEKSLQWTSAAQSEHRNDDSVGNWQGEIGHQSKAFIVWKPFLQQCIYRKIISAVLSSVLDWILYLSRVKSLTHHLCIPDRPGLKCWPSVWSGAPRSLWSQQQSDYYWHCKVLQTPAPGALSLKFCSGCACIRLTAFFPRFHWSAAQAWNIPNVLDSRSKIWPP